MLELKKRNGIYYIRGTVHFGKDRRSVYESTGIRIGERGAIGTARRVLENRKAQILEELEHGPQSQTTFAQVADRYLTKRRARLIEENPLFDPRAPDPVGEQIVEFIDWLEARGHAETSIGKLPQDEMDAFFQWRHIDRGNTLATAQKHASSIIAVLNDAAKAKLCTKDFPRPDLGKARRRIRPILDKWFEPGEVAWMLGNAPTHFQPTVAMLLATGRRTADIAWLARPGRFDKTKHSGELILEQGKERIYLGLTKNGEPMETYLPDWLLPILHGHLARRMDRHPELFLTDKGEPYLRPRVQSGGVFRKAWGTLVYRLAVELLLRAWLDHAPGSTERAHLISRSKIVRQATPHWCRHNIGSWAPDDAAAMDHGGWLDPRMAKRYRHVRPERGKQIANSLGFAPTQSPDIGAESVQPLALNKNKLAK